MDGDRSEFVGRNGALDRPAALLREGRLSGRTGAAMDPCGVLQRTLTILPGARVEVVSLLGETATRVEARALITRYRSADIAGVLTEVEAHWETLTGVVAVRTPDRALDLMLNRRLLHQTIACRLWSRSAFYQAGGAFGFRDQLQDVMAVAIAAPAIAREHILRAASRQFVEGDVQHWWHPPTGRGVRTRISDDALWLPYVTFQYVTTTGDSAVLSEVVAFLDGPVLAATQEESYFQPGVSPESATLFEHCARALDRALAVGVHGLPLMGTGDWNDGMNRVGRLGRGESVWLGWFLAKTLADFATVADHRGDLPRAASWRVHARAVAAAIEKDGWDGAWYRRAYFDDGTPLGTAASDECRIDAIAQSWSVISGGAPAERAQSAMAAVSEHLVRTQDGVMPLLDPPFDRSALDPGYIKGYPPGIRENGGQYTHAAIWSVIAFAMMGDGDRAYALYSMLNPIRHAMDPVAAAVYRVEPYVVAGDIYTDRAHVGRGGWTWYTGSAGWMYRAGLEWILGVRIQGDTLIVAPAIPRAWSKYAVTYRFRTARYEIEVENPKHVSRGVVAITVDGHESAIDRPIPLLDDGRTHTILVVLG